MAFIKHASFAVLEAEIAQPGAGLMRTAHRASFEYTPRPGFLYVRSRAISSRTNDNFDTFPAEEIAAAWRTFIGKPVFVNHHNENHKRARGVIIDAALHEDVMPDGTPDTWVEVLQEVDALRFPLLAQAIINGDIERTSMGCDVAHSECSVCGNVATTPSTYCPHISRMKGTRIRRRHATTGAPEDVLVHEICRGISFFENSLLVEPPADPTAHFLGVDTRGLDMVKSAAASRRPNRVSYEVFGRIPPDGREMRLQTGAYTNEESGVEALIHDLDRAARSTDADGNAIPIFVRLSPGGDWEPEKFIEMAKENLSRTSSRRVAKDARFDGVSLKQDDDGWYVTTHRARSDSYPTPEDIPESTIAFIESTGSINTASETSMKTASMRVLAVTDAEADAILARFPERVRSRAEAMRKRLVYGPAYDRNITENLLDSARFFQSDYPGTLADAEYFLRKAEAKEIALNGGEFFPAIHPSKDDEGQQLRMETSKVANQRQYEMGYADGRRDFEDGRAPAHMDGDEYDESDYDRGYAAGYAAAAHRNDISYDPKRFDPSIDWGTMHMPAAASVHTAFGETAVPPKIDTLRISECPVCGEDASNDGDGRCRTCGYRPPPEPFREPDLEVAQRTDLHDGGWFSPDLMSAPPFSPPNDSSDGTVTPPSSPTK